MGIFKRHSVVGRAGFVAAVVGLLFFAEASWSADCGGPVACQCGDTVVADAVLGDHLDGCDGVGLRIVSGNLDCADHQISGPGTRSGLPGIHVDAGSGTSVRNCRVRNFAVGVLVDGGSGHVLTGNVLFDNIAGVWVGSAATGTQIDGNEIHDNADEGVHLGSDTSLAVVSNNSIHNNDGENIYLLFSRENTITANVLDQSKLAAIFVKQSVDNTFTDNQVLKRPVVIRGGSHGNVFTNTDLASGGFVIEAFEDSEGVWTYPYGNVVTGGHIDASTCFEIYGGYDNTATDVVVDSCRYSQELEFGGLVPYGNSISVIDESPGSGSSGSGSGSSGTGRRGKLKFSRRKPAQDKLKVSYFFDVPGEILPGSEAIAITLTDTDSVIYRVELPAGALVERDPAYYRYSDKTRSLNGLRQVKLRHYGGTLWRLNVDARSDLITADKAEMTLSWTIGDDDFQATDTWVEKRRGWKLRN